MLPFTVDVLQHDNLIIIKILYVCLLGNNHIYNVEGSGNAIEISAFQPLGHKPFSTQYIGFPYVGKEGSALGR